jgi:DNA-binding PadR family transcriptional regulator
MPAARARDLTTPDLVLLSLLAERPMHGYEANLELERRDARDWAAISRPQVYYSLEKLARLGLIRVAEDQEAAAGPERRLFATTAKGRAALAEALEREDWTTHRERPPFLTWITLSWQARPGVFERQLQRRRKFLEEEVAREDATLRAIRKEVGHRFHEAIWMVTLTIQQFRTELRWLEKLSRELPRRAPARGVPPPPGTFPLPPPLSSTGLHRLVKKQPPEASHV